MSIVACQQCGEAFDNDGLAWKRQCISCFKKSKAGEPPRERSAGAPVQSGASDPKRNRSILFQSTFRSLATYWSGGSERGLTAQELLKEAISITRQAEGFIEAAGTDDVSY